VNDVVASQLWAPNGALDRLIFTAGPGLPLIGLPNPVYRVVKGRGGPAHDPPNRSNKLSETRCNSMKDSSTASRTLLGAIATLGFCVICAGPSKAFIVNVGGTNWDVSTIDSTFDESKPLLEAQPWFVGSPSGDLNIARDFAINVGEAFGQPNSFGGQVGPFFVWDDTGGFIKAQAVNSLDPSNPCPPATDRCSFGLGQTGQVLRTYAVATRSEQSSDVPGPLPIFGAAAAYGYSRRLRKRIEGSMPVA